VQLRLDYANYRAIGGDESGGQSFSRDAASLADETHDQALSLAARCSLAGSLLHQGRLRDGIAVTERGLTDDALRDLETDAESVQSLVYLLGVRGQLLFIYGPLDEARDALRRATEIAPEVGTPETTGYLHGFWVEHAGWLGDPELADHHGKLGLECAGLAHTPLQTAQACLSLGRAHLLSGRWSEALEVFGRARYIVDKRRALWGLSPRVMVSLAIAQLGKGEPERARRSIERMFSSEARAPGALVDIDVQLALARALLRTRGDAEAIQSALAGATERVEHCEARICQPHIHETLAELAEQAGQPDIGARQRSEAQRLFIELGATGHARRIAAGSNAYSCQDGALAG